MLKLYNGAMEDTQAHELVVRIKADMVRAMKDRKGIEVSASRSLLASISNAEVVPAPNQTHVTSDHIAGASAGVGSTEVPRKQLSYTDLQVIIEDEIQEIQAAKEQLDESSDYAIELDQKIAMLRGYQ